MKLLHLAVASIVDANTRFGPVAAGGTIDYSAAERRGRSIRARSVAGLFAKLRAHIRDAIESGKTRVRQRRDIRRLKGMKDYLLDDIGLSRADLNAVEFGHTTLDELFAARGERSRIATTVHADPAAAPEAANQDAYLLSKCA